MAEAEFLAVLTTTDSEESAQALAASVVAERLAACAQIDGPIKSVYRWQGKTETDAEWRVLLKTTAVRYGELEAHIKSLHSYDTPEIIATPITAGSDEYLAWLRTETQTSN
ncbi:divalent-cation tolerance protein CutA [Streptomyces sp. WMMB 322]|uniref:divalent-cation tolerance protein CutA n=1 Tax=Streptomyces sp. WMMB 322 TaxID=1286821 RepID=UPI0006E24184|nr:divalent-cation tolerance protein CutA [Streptomyces sp. WMMB 322]SCK52398.1 divalent cation tolerance protein [Streptomyces sp. WMMB 322]